jgi:two-component system, sensor histidine kinase and response regulator
MEHPVVLMVDDDPINLQILEESLSDLGLIFHRALSGVEALAQVRQWEYALVLMDVQMPELDGFQTVQQMRKITGDAMAPVIFLSAVYTEAHYQIEGIETGAVDFLAKPFDERILRGKVRILIDLYRKRKRLEREIERRRQAQAVADKASRAKAEFLANISHDIRTPMNVILGMADMLMETPLTDEQHRYVTLFRSAGNRLLDLINDIIALTRTDYEHDEIESVEFDLVDLVEKTGELFAIDAQRKGLELLCRIDPAVPPVMIGDLVRLRQVLVNLIGNAVKFTQRGDIIVDVGLENPNAPSNSGDPLTLVFTIRDTGIGIASEKLTGVFECFEQEDTSTTRRYEGAGLGLTISKKLVEAMGGRIILESTPEIGTTLQFDWTGRQCQNHTAEFAAGSITNAGRLWLAIRHPVGRKMIEELATAWGLTVEMVSDDVGVVTFLERWRRSGCECTVAIADEAAITEDPSAVTQLLGSNSNMAARLIVTIDADSSSSLILQLKRLGLRHVLNKPVKRQELRAAIENVLAPHQPCASAAGASACVNTTEDAAMKILLVDDSEDNILLIKAFLKKTPHRLISAANGLDGLQKFKSEPFDLVLMDMHMPLMDGCTATREIRRWEETRQRQRTPVIALTANAMKEDQQASLAAGCDRHLTKPLNRQALLAILATIPVNVTSDPSSSLTKR